MTPTTTAVQTDNKLEQEAKAIDAVLEEIKGKSNKHHHITVRQVGHRLQKLLKERGISIKDLIAGNLGEAEIIGPTTDERTRALYKDALRAILRGLCERGVTALAFERCVLPAFDMNPHRDPRGLIGYPESVLGIYPEWLVPERFLKAIRRNAAVPQKVREEFRRFAEAEAKAEGEASGINERTMNCYWGNLLLFVDGLGLQSLMDLRSPEATERLVNLIKERGYARRTSTLAHLRRVLRFFMGLRNPLDLKDEFGHYLIRVPKTGRKPVIKEGASFVKNKTRHAVVGGMVMEARLPITAMKRLLATPIASTDFRRRQEDVLARFLAVIKDRPVECWARNHNSWVLHDAIEGNEESRLFAGDGIVRTNYRDSVKKSRPDKPFPKWLAERLKALWKIRREHFAKRGDCDLRVRPAQGLLNAGVALWADPRSGQRASQDQILRWARNGLKRAGMKPYIVEAVTGYWFRRSVITAEAFQGAIFEATCKSSGHDPETALRHYVGQDEMAYKVALERITYWAPMGIAGNASHEIVPAQARASSSSESGTPPAATPAVGEDGLLKEAAAKRLGKSIPTLRRWAKAGLIGTVGSNGSTLFSARDIDALREGYMTPREIASARRLSEGNIRRLCREGKIPGVRRVGRKTYLIPVKAAMHLG